MNTEEACAIVDGWTLVPHGTVREIARTLRQALAEAQAQRDNAINGRNDYCVEYKKHQRWFYEAKVERDAALRKLDAAMKVIEAAIRFRDDATGSNDAINNLWDALDQKELT